MDDLCTVNGGLIEACAGLLDGNDTKTCVRKNANEKTGHHIFALHKVFKACMSPGVGAD